MRNRGQLVFGLILVVLGLISLVSTLFHIDFGAICWPVFLIGVGVWLVLRPQFSNPDSATQVSLIGDRRRRGDWTVRSEEYWLGVGDVELDMTQAVIPPGEAVLRFYTFVSDVDIYIPRSVGVTVQVNGFVIDSDLLGQDRETFLSPVSITSDNYATADCKVKIEMNGFVANLKVKHL